MTPVPRFVAPRRYSGTGTFSPEAEEHPANGITSFADLRHRRATLVLGEPGAGKSTALRTLRVTLSSNPHDSVVRFFDLRDYSQSDLGEALKELGAIDIPAEKHAYLLLDSIDEAKLKIDTLVPFLARRLEPALDRGWRIIATCRTAETVRAIDDFFESLEAGAQHVLLPLRKSDAAAIAAGRGLDADALLQVVREQSLESLAAVPFTLDLLCTAYAADGAMGSSRTEVFERAVALLLAQGAPAEDGYVPPLQLPARPLAVELAAERLALFAALTDSTGLGLYRPGEPTTGLATELVAGGETRDDVSFDINQELLQSVLQTPLFADSGVGQRTFAHRSLRDYLAARCLTRWDLEPTQLESFLTASNGLASIPPQVLDIATWLVLLNAEAFDWLVNADGLNLTRNRIAVYRPELAPRLVAWLLEHAGDSNRVLGWRDALDGLVHAGLPDQLRNALAGSEQEQRRMALSILEDSYVAGLETELLQVVLTPEASARDRRDAVRILGAQQCDEQLGQLVSLPPDFFDGDEHAEIRAAVVEALWPAHLTTRQMLELLVTPPEHYYGGYQMFLHHVEVGLATSDAAEILRWGASGLPSTVDDDAPSSASPHGRSIRGLVEGACVEWLASSDHAAADFDHLAAILNAQLDHHPSKLPVARGTIPIDVWRELLRRLVQLRAAESHGYFAVLTARDADGSPLLLSTDLSWVAELSVQVADPEGDAWKQLVDRMFDFGDLSHLETIWNYRGTPLWDVVGWRFEPILLDSPEARRLREHWTLLHGGEPKPDDAHSMSPDDYRAQMSEVAAQIAAEPAKFWFYARWLDVNIASSTYQDSYTPDLFELASAELLEAPARAQILDLAVAYLEALSDDILPQEPKASTRFFQLTAAYQALHTLQKHAPQRIDAADIDWGALALSILDYPLHFAHGEDNAAVRRELLRRVHTHAESRLSAEVGRLFDRSAHSDTHAYVIGDLSAVLTPEILGHARSALSYGYFPDAPQVLQLFFDADPEEATAWSIARIAASDDIHEIAMNFLPLLGHSPDLGFRELYQFAEAREDLAKPVLLEIAQTERREHLRLAAVSETTLLELYEWLADRFPRSEEAFPTGMHAISAREDLAEWRDDILRRVVGSGTRPALEALTALARRRTDLGLEWALSSLREAYRQNGWTPLVLRELRALQDQSGARLVRSNDDLLRVVLEELATIQEWMRGETPQAFGLWNQGPDGFQVPKDENTISDWYCHGLRVRLKDRGLIINREVEVRRRTQRGVGLRQDLRVEVAQLDTGETFVLVVEVKGIWNSGLRTNLSSQLAQDYLIDGNLTHGIYLVVAFDPEQVSDPAKKATIARQYTPDLLELLQAQAKEHGPVLQIRAVLHDASLPALEVATAGA
ncbi:MAG TPA: hypothetical protein VNR37_07345 [Microbacteriaceae bacterium]|nr:hypothetical protein [Microbacteriaceae bacterium]